MIGSSERDKAGRPFDVDTNETRGVGKSASADMLGELREIIPHARRCERMTEGDAEQATTR